MVVKQNIYKKADNRQGPLIRQVLVNLELLVLDD
jgi:hypothetical protein